MTCSPRHISLLDSVVQEILDCGHWLHYGRRLLDEDKKSNISNSKDLIISIISSVVLPILFFILDKAENHRLMITIISVIVLCAIWIVFLFKSKNRYKLSSEDKSMLNVLLPQVESYHSNLISFLQKIDCRCSLSDKQISDKFNDFSSLKSQQATLRHNLSSVFGTINQDWQKESATLASEELRPFKQFYELKNT